MMRTPDGAWSVEVIRTRGGQSVRVKRRQVIGAHGGTWPATGQLVATIAEVRELLGPDFEHLLEDRSGRFDGGRRPVYLARLLVAGLIGDLQQYRFAQPREVNAARLREITFPEMISFAVRRDEMSAAAASATAAAISAAFAGATSVAAWLTVRGRRPKLKVTAVARDAAEGGDLARNDAGEVLAIRATNLRDTDVDLIDLWFEARNPISSCVGHPYLAVVRLLFD